MAAEKKTINGFDLSYSAWVRLCIREGKSLKQIQNEFAKLGWEGRKVPDQNTMNWSSNDIRQRWGVKASELPRGKNGKLVLGKMLALYLKKHGTENTETKAKEFFALNGLQFPAGTYYPLRKQISESSEKTPRAGKPKGKKTSIKSAKQTEDTLVDIAALFKLQKIAQELGGLDRIKVLLKVLEGLAQFNERVSV